MTQCFRHYSSACAASSNRSHACAKLIISALALTLAPLIRVLSLSLPLFRFPQAAWYPIVAIPLLLAAWVIILFSRRVGEASEATARADAMRVANVQLESEVSALEAAEQAASAQQGAPLHKPRQNLVHGGSVPEVQQLLRDQGRAFRQPGGVL